jgi:subtilisin family serine protease
VNGREAIANEIIVRSRTNDPAGLQPVRNGLSTDESVEVLNSELGLYLIRSRSRGARALLTSMAGRPEIQYAEPNYLIRADAIPNDPSLSQLWGMEKIGAPQAWNYATGGTAAVVGVVDTGVLYTHPDLAANIWNAPAAFTITVNGQQISCAAGAHGFNAVTRTCDPLDDNGHGTHVAGTIGAVGNNGVGVTGVNWNTRVMGLKFLEADGFGTTSNAIRAIEFAIRVKLHFAATATPVNVRVLSNSWSGTGFSSALLDEINSAGTNDMLFVAAAGNEATNIDVTPAYPAAYATANEIGVAATDINDGLAGFSNYGLTKVHLGAPGVNILSTHMGNGYTAMNGTSMATPHVSGVAALVLSACPSLNTAALKNALLNNVDPISSLAGKTITGGRLNAARAVTSCAGAPLPALSGLTVAPPVAQSGQNVVITATLTAPALSNLSVSLVSSNPAVIAVPPAMTIPSGSSSANITVQAGTVASAQMYTLTASYLGTNKTANGTVNPPPANSTATFVSLDTLTKGNWKEKYGSDGYHIAGDSSLNPAYVTPVFNNALFWSYATSVSDIRALQRASGSDRVAATWYQQPSFSVDLNFTDSNTHRVAIYCVDWDGYGPRSQTIEVLNAAGQVLDTRNQPGFVGGEYLIWDVTGFVRIRVTTLTTNAVIQGIFFGGPSGPPPPPPPANSASFVLADTTTQGNWRGAYGGEGYRIAGDATLNPAYGAPAFNNALLWTYAASSSDVRALQRASGSDRVAATWYQAPSFTIDLNFTDTNTHRVAIYCVDWDGYGPRSQIIDMIDADTNGVLDSRPLSSFTGGQYLVWNVSGRVRIRVTTLTTNAVIQGIFFDSPSGPPPPPPPSGTSASFVLTDTTTQGNWRGAYGSEGYRIAGDATLNPAYGAPAFNNALLWTYATSTSDVRALQRASGPDRVAATWYQAPSFTIDLNFTDTNTHRLGIYCVDWDGYGPRSQIIDILDADTNAVLNTQPVSSFTGGRYLVWNVSGHIRVRVTTLTTNAVIQGIFFDAAGSPAPPPPPPPPPPTTTTASFISLDTTTQGNWRGAYGSQGYTVAGDATLNPAYVTPAMNNAAFHTWAASTSDVRALQRASGPDRVAATWYQTTSFTVDLLFTDANTHRVAIYCVDWDGYGPRSQTVQVLNADTNAVLDTRLVSSFTGGQYLVWNVSGRIRIRVTSLATNAVVEGVFFE